MNIDITKFNKENVVDTCSIWNILSSNRFYSVAIDIVKEFAITEYVVYEALFKKRTSMNSSDKILKTRLEKEISIKKFKVYGISIADLQEVEILNNRRNLGKGEISSIAFAKKTGKLSFITEDQSARKFSREIVKVNTQTTSHILGWLFFEGYLLDGDLQYIVDEHKSFNGPLEKYFKEVYEEAYRCKLMK